LTAIIFPILLLIFVPILAKKKGAKE